MRKLFLSLIIGLAFLSCEQPEVDYSPDIGKAYSVSLSKSSEVWTYDFTGLGLDDSMSNTKADNRIVRLYAYYYDADVNLDEIDKKEHIASLEKASYYLDIMPGNDSYNGEWDIRSNLYVNNELDSIIAPDEITSSYFKGDVFGMQDFPEFNSASQIRISLQDQSGKAYIFEGDPNGEVICVEIIDFTQV